jgi:hypothetical protein
MTAATHPEARARSAVRAVAIPAEHGGWGLTGEPVLLGLALSPSLAGVALGLAAFVAFVARTPLRVVLVDRHRHRSLDRTRVARRVLAAEVALAVLLVTVAEVLAPHRFWAPALVAAPLVGLELWFDMRSRSRRLVPELAGAIGIGAVAAMIALAGGSSATAAIAAWAILAARSITAIPHVRAEVARLHHRATATAPLVLADVAALAIVVVAAILDRAFTAGAVAVAASIAVQRIAERRDAPAKVIGIRQTILGIGVVAVTAVGVHLA